MTTQRASISGCIGLALLLAIYTPAHAQEADPAAGPGSERTEELPEELEGVEIIEKLDNKLPLDLRFKNHNGKEVKLGDYFDGEKPVILTLNYYRCPMLCGLQLNGMVDALKEIDWIAGDQFRILTISFDPLETPQLAQAKRKNYLTYYDRPESAAGWSFLTGRKKNIDQVLDATGFGIQYDPKTNEWIHAAALILCTPDGRISRYLYGILYQPKTLRLSLVEASEGKIGTTVDRFLLYCFHFEEGEYTLAAFNIVRAVAILTLLVLGGVLTWFWRREARRQRTVTPTV